MFILNKVYNKLIKHKTEQLVIGHFREALALAHSYTKTHKHT